MAKNKSIGSDIKNNLELLPDKELDEGYYHEAHDRCYLVSSIIEEHLLKHRVFEKHPKLRAKIEKAQELIIELYQTTGALEHLKSIEPKN